MGGKKYRNQPVKEGCLKKWLYIEEENNIIGMANYK